jgi:tRNA(fMet)-specific endonuclease VapC
MSETVLLDTDVASFLFKKSPFAKPFRLLLKGKRLALAFVSVAELFKWTLKRQWGNRKTAQLEKALQRYVIIPYDRDLAWAWARVIATCEDAGKPIAPSDAWVAAAAMRHDVPLATNNLKHFEAAESLCGLKLLRP